MKIPVSHIKEEVRSLIAEGKIKESLDVLMRHSNNLRPKFVKDIKLYVQKFCTCACVHDNFLNVRSIVILLSYRYNTFRINKIRGTISDNTKLNEIVWGVLELLDMIEKKSVGLDMVKKKLKLKTVRMPFFLIKNQRSYKRTIEETF